MKVKFLSVSPGEKTPRLQAEPSGGLRLMAEVKRADPCSASGCTGFSRTTPHTAKETSKTPRIFLSMFKTFLRSTLLKQGHLQNSVNTFCLLGLLSLGFSQKWLPSYYTRSGFSRSTIAAPGRNWTQRPIASFAN